MKRFRTGRSEIPSDRKATIRLFYPEVVHYLWISPVQPGAIL